MILRKCNGLIRRLTIGQAHDHTMRDYRIVLSVFARVDPPLVYGLRRQLAALELVSHAPTRNYEGEGALSTAEDIGGRCPTGGDQELLGNATSDERAAFRESHYRRTVLYFRREIGRARTVDDLVGLRSEVEAAVEAWRRAPLPGGQEPEYGSPQWKRWIAESNEDAGRLADRFNLTRRRINQIRQEYAF